jgi:hypothetical protein
LGELKGTISELVDVDANIIWWVTLIFNIESQVLYLLDNTLELSAVIAYKYVVIHVHHKDDVAMVEHTVIYERWVKANGS